MIHLNNTETLSKTYDIPCPIISIQEWNILASNLKDGLVHAKFRNTLETEACELKLSYEQVLQLYEMLPEEARFNEERSTVELNKVAITHTTVVDPLERPAYNMPTAMIVPAKTIITAEVPEGRESRGRNEQLKPEEIKSILYSIQVEWLRDTKIKIEENKPVTLLKDFMDLKIPEMYKIPLSTAKRIYLGETFKDITDTAAIRHRWQELIDSCADMNRFWYVPQYLQDKYKATHYYP